MATVHTEFTLLTFFFFHGFLLIHQPLILCAHIQTQRWPMTLWSTSKRNNSKGASFAQFTIIMNTLLPACLSLCHRYYKQIWQPWWSTGKPDCSAKGKMSRSESTVITRLPESHQEHRYDGQPTAKGAFTTEKLTGIARLWSLCPPCLPLLLIPCSFCPSEIILFEIASSENRKG